MHVETASLVVLLVVQCGRDECALNAISIRIDQFGLQTGSNPVQVWTHLKKRTANNCLKTNSKKHRAGNASDDNISNDEPMGQTSEGALINLHSVASNIRKQIVSWQRRHKNKSVKALKEHDEFEIQVERDGSGYKAEIVCKVCTKPPVTLGQKNNKPLISNWSRHVITCMQAVHVSNKGKLDAFFSSYYCI